MASLNGRSFGNLKSSAGAVLFLLKPSAVTTTVALGNGVDVSFALREEAVILTGLQSFEGKSIAAEAIELANRACDLVTAQGGRGGTLDDPGDRHIIWWTDSESSVLRLWAGWSVTGTLSAGGGPAVGDGQWHESLRYFRISEETDDLFDAFRHVYLGIESVLSTLAPQQLKPNGAPAESDTQWLKRALNEAGKSMALTGYGPGVEGDPVEDIVKDLYVLVRTAIFHAKTNRRVVLPRDWGDRAQVVAAKVRYSRLLVDLVRLTCGISLRYGGMRREFMEEALQNVVGGWQLFVTDDASRPAESDSSPSPLGKEVKLLTAQRRPELDLEGRSAVTARARVDGLGALRSVGRFGAVDADRQLALVESFGVVELDEVDELEVVLAGRHLNGNLPRSAYPV